MHIVTGAAGERVKKFAFEPRAARGQFNAYIYTGRTKTTRVHTLPSNRTPTTPTPPPPTKKTPGHNIFTMAVHTTVVTTTLWNNITRAVFVDVAAAVNPVAAHRGRLAIAPVHIVRDDERGAYHRPCGTGGKRDCYSATICYTFEQRYL